jgi:hypothetical protein
MIPIAAAVVRLGIAQFELELAWLDEAEAAARKET